MVKRKRTKAQTPAPKKGTGKKMVAKKVTESTLGIPPVTLPDQVASSSQRVGPIPSTSSVAPQGLPPQTQQQDAILMALSHLEETNQVLLRRVGDLEANKSISSTPQISRPSYQHVVSQSTPISHPPASNVGSFDPTVPVDQHRNVGA